MFKLRNLVILLCLFAFVVPAFAQDGPLVSLGSTEELGEFLVGPNGMTLYLFPPDPVNVSVCSGRCLENWPALTVESEDELTLAEGIPGTLGTFVREDNGAMQVTYNGIPLYYWVRDQNPGDTTGNRVGRIWWVVPPATVYNQRVPELGSVLVGPTGMTLYIFNNDEPGVSNCVDQCAENWPPLTVESADGLVPGLYLQGELGTIERADGSLQVTYNGWPLYYWKDDAAIGDATGEGVGDVWWTVVPETVALSSGGDLGDFLTSFDGMTLYTFTNDAEGVSNCADECATNWPPFTLLEGERVAAPAGVEGELGTIERADGSIQVTYNGWPLYFWKDDAAPGDTLGQGLGDVWFVAAP
jgi:predicted lipoprotein with Yx(FWY)xxD motif